MTTAEFDKGTLHLPDGTRHEVQVMLRLATGEIDREGQLVAAPELIPEMAAAPCVLPLDLESGLPLRIFVQAIEGTICHFAIVLQLG